MSKRGQGKVPRKGTIPTVNTQAILAAWIRLDKIPTGQLCQTCKGKEIKARVECYEGTETASELKQRIAGESISEEQFARRRFEEIYQEQQTRQGPQYRGTQYFCGNCLVGLMLHAWIGPHSTPAILQQLDTYGERIGIALYRRKTRPLRFAAMTTFETTPYEVWRQKTMVEHYQGVPGQRFIIHNA